MIHGRLPATEECTPVTGPFLEQMCIYLALWTVADFVKKQPIVSQRLKAPGLTLARVSPGSARTEQVGC